MSVKMSRAEKGYGRRRFCILWALLAACFVAVSACPVRTAAEEIQELPGEVVRVKNERQMIKRLISGMKKHQSYFSFYYPGIGRDFAEYGRQSETCQPFLDKLAVRDGYITGILSGSCITIGGKTEQYVTFQFNYMTTKAQEKKIDAKVKRLSRRFKSGSRAVRARKAHDYLIDHMQYAFIRGKGLCMAYALAYQRLLQEMDIPCVYVKGVNHAWNMVKIGKYWYNVDVTWDDSGGDRYRYFLKSDRDFPRHIPVKSRNYPSLSRAKTSYRFP